MKTRKLNLIRAPERKKSRVITKVLIFSWFLIKGTRKSKYWSFKFRPSKSSPRKLNSRLDLDKKPHQYLQKPQPRSFKSALWSKSPHRSQKSVIAIIKNSFSQKLQNPQTPTHSTPLFKPKTKNLTSRALFINNHSKLSLFYIYYHLWQSRSRIINITPPTTPHPSLTLTTKPHKLKKVLAEGSIFGIFNFFVNLIKPPLLSTYHRN